MLIVYNTTGAPITLAGLTVVVPASAAPPARGEGVDVTSELEGLTSVQYDALEAQRAASGLQYVWDTIQMYQTGLLDTTYAIAPRAYPIRVGVDPFPFPPWNDNWPPTGFEPNVRSALLTALQTEYPGMTFELRTADFGDLITELVNNRVDCVMAAMSITDARRLRGTFTQAYMKTPSVMVGLIANPVAVDWNVAASVAGQKLATIVATTFDAYLIANGMSVAAASYTTYANQAALEAALLGAVEDIAMMDQGSANAFIAANPLWEIKGPAAPASPILGNGVGILCNKTDQALVDLLNRGIQKIVNDGTLDALATAAFGFPAPPLPGPFTPTDVQQFTAATRPAASDVPAGRLIINSTTGALNYSDGTAWFDYSGAPA